jgi:hypothetical protein
LIAQSSWSRAAMAASRCRSTSRCPPLILTSLDPTRSPFCLAGEAPQVPCRRRRKARSQARRNERQGGTRSPARTHPTRTACRATSPSRRAGAASSGERPEAVRARVGLLGRLGPDRAPSKAAYGRPFAWGISGMPGRSEWAKRRSSLARPQRKWSQRARICTAPSASECLKILGNKVTQPKRAPGSHPRGRGFESAASLRTRGLCAEPGVLWLSPHPLVVRLDALWDALRRRTPSTATPEFCWPLPRALGEWPGD